MYVCEQKICAVLLKTECSNIVWSKLYYIIYKTMKLAVAEKDKYCQWTTILLLYM